VCLFVMYIFVIAAESGGGEVVRSNSIVSMLLKVPP
jgi:hypothetical protein